MFVLELAICNCYLLNKLHIIVVPPMNDKIDTMINDYDQVTQVWPPAVGEHVVVNFEDGWFIGEGRVKMGTGLLISAT